MTELTKKQKGELERRAPLYESGNIHYGYDCPCGHHSFLGADYYVVAGVGYPIITGYSNYEGAESWTEDHKCPKCGKETQYYDGT